MEICLRTIRKSSFNRLLKTSHHHQKCHLGNKASEANHPASRNRKEHPYHKAEFITSMSRDQRSKYLLSQVLFNDDGVVVLNKPYGLASNKQNINIYESIPFLAKHLGYDEDLRIVSIPPRDSSGLTILAANRKREALVDKCFRRTKTLAPATSKLHLAVTVGVPIQEKSVNKYAMTVQFKGITKYHLILRNWTENARKRQEVNVGLIGHKKVSGTNEASLLSLGTWLYQHHCPRVFLSDVLLSPVLGDEKYGVRVGSLFDKTIHIKPWNAPATKYLPESLLLPLHLYKGEESFIPVHLHLHELRLMKLFDKKHDLVLGAPPPEYFQWSCQQLGLSIPVTKPCEFVAHEELSYRGTVRSQ